MKLLRRKKNCCECCDCKDLEKRLNALQAMVNQLVTQPSGGCSYDTSRQLYVDQSATGGFTPDGSATCPYPTIGDALAQVQAPAVDNQYALIVGPGIYNEDIELPPFTSINGLAIRTPTVQGNLTLRSDWNNSVGSNSYVSRLDLSGDAIIDFVGVAAGGGSVSFSNCNLSLGGASVNTCQELTHTVAYYSSSLNELRHVSGALFMENTNANELQIQQPVPAIFGVVGQIRGCTITDLVAGEEGFITTSALVVNFLELQGNIDYESNSSLPRRAQTNIAPGVNLTRVNHAFGFNYDPTNPNDWQNTNPNNGQELFDEIGARLTAGGL
jgi:hypothetical protein